MIRVVFLRLCFLIVFCVCQSLLDEEEISNDYPFDVPKLQTKTMRVKNGTPLTLKCHQERAKWQFKPCDSNFYGIVCNENRHWKKLENETRGRIHIKAATQEYNGVYKCSKNDVPIMIFVLDVYDPSYTGSPPTVHPLQTTNITGSINIEFTIQCKVTSEVPPTIIWFKSCYGNKCDFPYHQTCYCHINTSTSISSYATGSTYFSKYLIFDARDVDSGIYVCLAVNQFGRGDRNVTITVPGKSGDNNLYSLLFWVPLLVPLMVCACAVFIGKKKSVIVVEQRKQLIGTPGGQANEVV